jgi:hypothetical protein
MYLVLSTLDFHPLDYAHAGRIKIEPALLKENRLECNMILLYFLFNFRTKFDILRQVIQISRRKHNAGICCAIIKAIVLYERKMVLLYVFFAIIRQKRQA